jgi:hypothetical protein
VWVRLDNRRHFRPDWHTVKRHPGVHANTPPVHSHPCRLIHCPVTGRRKCQVLAISHHPQVNLCLSIPWIGHRLDLLTGGLHCTRAPHSRVSCSISILRMDHRFRLMLCMVPTRPSYATSCGRRIHTVTMVSSVFHWLLALSVVYCLASHYG